MQKFLMPVLGLLLSMTGTLYAQPGVNHYGTPEDRVFDLPFYSIREAWHIDLGGGNYLELELTDLSQLARFQNVDSLLLVFIGDMKIFGDSLADAFTAKGIDLLVDAAGRKIVRIRQTRPSGASFLLGDGEPSILRLRQDTVRILLSAPPPMGPRPATGPFYDRLTLVINRYGDLDNLVVAGLNSKMHELGSHRNRDWAFSGRPHESYLVRDPSVRTMDDSVYWESRDQSFLELDAFINLQNYKDYFLPSVGLGAAVGFFSRPNINQLGLHWEPLFFFAPDAKGQLETFRNDLLVFNYDYRRSDEKPNPLAPFGMRPNLSFGWFVHREGGYFQKNSFRLTAGSVSLMRTRFLIEPCIYFNNFFKGVTPGLRFSFKVL
jgi:hypothetical protein